MTRYPHPITIKRAVRAETGRSYTIGEELVFSGWGLVLPGSGNKRELFGQQVVEETFTVTVQYDPRLDPREDLYVDAQVNGRMISLEAIGVAPAPFLSSDMVLTCRRRKNGS